MKKLGVVALVLFVVASALAVGYYEEVFSVKATAARTITTRPFSVADVDSITFRVTTSDSATVILQRAILVKPTSTVTYANIDTLTGAAGTEAIGYAPGGGIYGVRFRASVTAVDVTSGEVTVHGAVTVEN